MNNLLKMIFPTNEVRAFLCNDLFIELKNVVPINLCINKENVLNTTRKEHYKQVKNLIYNFLIKNKIYLNKLKQFYSTTNINYILKNIITSYVFVMAKLNKNYKNVDIFNNKTSICYVPFNIFNTLI